MTEPTPTAADVATLARRLYAQGPASLRYRQRLRVRICPFEHVLGQVPIGSTVLDVGCGGGLLLGLLAVTGRIVRGHGFDRDAAAIEMATAMQSRLGSEGEGLAFETRDADANWPDGSFDVVTIVDVLHHLPAARRPEVVAQAARRVRPGGRLLLKDMRHRPRWRAWANRVHDLVLARQWVREPHPRHLEEWVTAAGLQLVHHETCNRWWYGHALWVFRRPATTP